MADKEGQEFLHSYRFSKVYDIVMENNLDRENIFQILNLLENPFNKNIDELLQDFLTINLKISNKQELCDDIQKINDYKILSNCIDYPILKENLSEDKLKQLEKDLESFEYYKSIYDDGDIDIVSEYKSKYGNNDLINWYEGIMSTDSFIEIVNLEKEGKLNNEL